MSAERPTKRARSAVACRRCKHRKQRCDNAFPACSACVAAGDGEGCSYESKVHPPEYVESLEKRVVDLERLLQSQAQQQANTAQVTPPTSSPQTARSTHSGHVQGQDTTAGNDTAADNAFDMLASSSFLGTSSGYPLAKAVHAVIGSSQQQWRNDHESTTPAAREAGMPDGVLGRQLIEVYLSKVHPKHPFLSPWRILRLHEVRASLRRHSEDRPLLTRLNSFTLCMVYTISARYHQLSQNEYSCNPDAYYAAAMEDVECLFQHPALETLEGSLLLVLFQLRSSRPTEIWSLLGLTMRHAISIGLHRKFNGPRLLDERRKRIFWTIYMLERSIARTMGRPMSISDRDIDVDLPANVDENIDNESDMICALQQDRGPTTMSAVIHIFRLTRLESKIYASVHRVDRPLSSVSTNKSVRLRQLLDQWREEISIHVPDLSDDQNGGLVHYYATASYHILHYHLALLLLLLPSLTTLPAHHLDFQTCVTSAGQVCQLYKRLHDRQSVLAYSIIALHATFVAGLTLVYCFIAEPSTLNIQFNSDIRACSTVLYVISERWPAARKVRDAFERMLSRTVERVQHVEQPDVQLHAPFDTMWSEIATQFSCDNTIDRDDIWNALGPWFDLNDEGFLKSGVGEREAYGI